MTDPTLVAFEFHSAGFSSGLNPFGFLRILLFKRFCEIHFLENYLAFVWSLPGQLFDRTHKLDEKGRYVRNIEITFFLPLFTNNRDNCFKLVRPKELAKALSLVLYYFYCQSFSVRLNKPFRQITHLSSFAFINVCIHHDQSVNISSPVTCQASWQSSKWKDNIDAFSAWILA